MLLQLLTTCLVFWDETTFKRSTYLTIKMFWACPFGSGYPLYLFHGKKNAMKKDAATIPHASLLPSKKNWSCNRSIFFSRSSK